MTYCPTQPADESLALEAAARYRARAVLDFLCALSRARQARPHLSRLDAYRAAAHAGTVAAHASAELRRAAALYRVARRAADDAYRRELWTAAQDAAAPCYQTTSDTAERR